MKSVVFISLTMYLFTGGTQDDQEEKVNKKVLNERKIGKETFFKAAVSEGILEYRVTTAISFKDSIPTRIFIHCTKNGGDLYTFSKP